MEKTLFCFDWLYIGLLLRFDLFFARLKIIFFLIFSFLILDSTMSKHCGTIFLNDTHSRPTIKKDGSSAYNKKNSFKVNFKFWVNSLKKGLYIKVFDYRLNWFNHLMTKWMETQIVATCMYIYRLIRQRQWTNG